MITVKTEAAAAAADTEITVLLTTGTDIGRFMDIQKVLRSALDRLLNRVMYLEQWVRQAILPVLTFILRFVLTELL